MKPNEANEPGESVFLTGTCVSDAEPWFKSLLRQIRELQEERKHPHTPVQITAQRDMSALGKLVNQPPAYTSLIAQIKDLIEDVRHPHKIETTATLVEVEEIWSRQNDGVPRLVSVGVHVLIVILALIPWATASKPLAPQATNVMLIQPTSLVLPMMNDSSGGGGGGGKHQLTPLSQGRLPKAA